MKDQDLIIIFITSWVTTWLLLFLFYLLFLNKRKLMKKGYTLEFIRFMRKDYIKRMRGIGIAIPILLLVACGIFWLFSGRPESYREIMYIFIIFYVLVFPFPISDYFRSKNSYSTYNYHPQVEKDIKANKFFNPLVEFCILLLFIMFTVLIIQMPFMVYIHLVIPWILYFVSIKSRYVTLSILRDGYLNAFIFMELNYLLVIFYIARYGLISQNYLSADQKLFSLLLMAIMFSRMIYYIMNFRRIYHMLS
jgi:hypothetical protein